MSKLLKEHLSSILSSLKEDKSAKFNQSIDVSFNLNVIQAKSKQVTIIRGDVNMPHVTRPVNIAVFIDPEYHDQVKQLGAKWVGGMELLLQIKKGNVKPTHVISTYSYLHKLKNASRILGARNLMPRKARGTLPKNIISTFISDSESGTLCDNVEDISQAIQACQQGLTEYKSDKFGSIKLSLGYLDTPIEHLVENFLCIYESINKKKPADIKGRYWKDIHFSTTMSRFSFHLPQELLNS